MSCILGNRICKRERSKCILIIPVGYLHSQCFILIALVRDCIQQNFKVRRVKLSMWSLVCYYSHNKCLFAQLVHLFRNTGDGLHQQLMLKDEEILHYKTRLGLVVIHFPFGCCWSVSNTCFQPDYDPAETAIWHVVSNPLELDFASHRDALVSLKNVSVCMLRAANRVGEGMCARRTSCSSCGSTRCSAWGRTRWTAPRWARWRSACCTTWSWWRRSARSKVGWGGWEGLAEWRVCPGRAEGRAAAGAGAARPHGREVPRADLEVPRDVHQPHRLRGEDAQRRQPARPERLRAPRARPLLPRPGELFTLPPAPLGACVTLARRFGCLWFRNVTKDMRSWPTPPNIRLKKRTLFLWTLLAHQSVPWFEILEC